MVAMLRLDRQTNIIILVMLLWTVVHLYPVQFAMLIGKLPATPATHVSRDILINDILQLRRHVE